MTKPNNELPFCERKKNVEDIFFLAQADWPRIEPSYSRKIYWPENFVKLFSVKSYVENGVDWPPRVSPRSLKKLRMS